MGKEQEKIEPAENIATQNETVKDSETERAPLVYVGPPIRKRGLSSYMVFKDGVPDIAKGDGILEKLFVPVRSLNSAMEQTKRKGSMLHTFYQKALEED